MGRVMSIEEAAAGLSGARIAFGGRLHSRKSLGFVEALIESEAEALDLVVGHGGMEVDLLVGAGAVSSVNRVYVGCDPFGPAPFYKAAVRDGRVQPIESSEYLTVIGMRAAALGCELPSVQGGSWLRFGRGARPEESDVSIYGRRVYGGTEDARRCGCDSRQRGG